MRYPVRKADDWDEYRKRSAISRVEIAWRDFRYRRRVRDHNPDPDLRPQGGAVTALSADDIPLIVCVKNGSYYLRYFLAHYRRLGVTRFIVLDDGSDDGTAATLAGEADVDVFTSTLDYTAARRGLVWRDALIRLYGRNRWYLSVDIDEFLVYPGCENRPLSDFIADLRAAGLDRSLAPMLDLYPDGPLSNNGAAGGSTPLEISPLIDGDGYDVANRKFCASIVGGARRRLFRNEIRLSKFPVIFVDEATRYHGGSIHAPLPFRRNFAPVTAALLHFKFSANSIAEFAEIVARGNHFDNARFYRMIVDSDDFGADMDLRYGGSMRIHDSEDLVRNGFMQDLRKA